MAEGLNVMAYPTLGSFLGDNIYIYFFFKDQKINAISR